MGTLAKSYARGPILSLETIPGASLLIFKRYYGLAVRRNRVVTFSALPEGGRFLICDDSPPHGKPKPLDRLRQALQARHYSRRTAQAYVFWVRRFILLGVRHPTEMAEPEINAFLVHLAVQDKVSASTQNQALSALLFLYRQVPGREVGDLGDVIRARKPKPLPVVMTREEVKAVMGHLIILNRGGMGVRSPVDSL